MGYTIASCGHEIGPASRTFQISIGDFDRDGDPTVSYLPVCEYCKNAYKMSGRNLETSADEQDWLNGF